MKQSREKNKEKYDLFRRPEQKVKNKDQSVSLKSYQGMSNYGKL